MRKLYAYIFLGIMLNVVLFHSMDTPDENAYITTQDPVNSLTEFVIEICFNILDNQPGDERQSESNHFKLAKLVSTTCPLSSTLLRKNYLIHKIVSNSQRLDISSVIITITNPPPEFTA